MQINSRGQIAHGVGGHNAHLNNIPFCSGAIGGWITDDLIIFANANDNWYINSYDINSKKISRVEPVGANILFANNNHMAFWLDGYGMYYSAMPQVLPNAGLIGMGFEGEIAYKPQYHSNGPTLIRNTAGLESQLTQSVPSSIHLLGKDRAIWLENYELYTRNLPIAHYEKGDGVYHVQGAFAGGEWWVSYWSVKRGLVLHPFQTTQRTYSIVPKGDAYYAMRAIDKNIIRISHSPSAAEQSIYVLDIDVIQNLCRDPFTNGNWNPIKAVPIESINQEVPVCNIGYPVNDREGNCPQCGHPKNQHQLIGTEPPVATTPDHSAVIRQLDASYPHLLKSNTRESITEFMWRAGSMLTIKDPEWGFLSKTPSEKHIVIEGVTVSVDSFIYKKTQQVVDTISNALESTPAATSWSHQPKRPDNNWTEIPPYHENGNAEPPPDNSELEQKVEDLENQVRILTEELNNLKRNAITTGQKISLRGDTGKYVCEDRNPGTNHNGYILISNRDSVGAWEQFRIDKT